jgi:hypothetical protein
LLELGQEARFKRFVQIWTPMSLSKKLIKQEKQSLKKLDASNFKNRKIIDINNNNNNYNNKDNQQLLTLKEKWKIELYEAFSLLVLNLTNPFQLDENEEKRFIGRVGFKKLLKNGKLLGVKNELQVDEFFNTIDASCQGVLKFEIVWTWFVYMATKRDKFLMKNYNRHFTFTVNDILTVEERSLIILNYKFGMLEFSTNSDNNSIFKDAYEKSKRRKKGNLFSDDDENAYESSDEESMFNDTGNLQYAHIGELMRYVVKQNLTKTEKKNLSVLNNNNNNNKNNNNDNGDISIEKLNKDANNDNNNNNNEEKNIKIVKDNNIDEIKNIDINIENNIAANELSLKNI